MTAKYEEFTKRDLKRIIVVCGISVVVILIGIVFLVLVGFPIGFIIFILFCVGEHFIGLYLAYQNLCPICSPLP